MGDHAETVEVTFDPRRISYEALLDHYWQSFPYYLPPGPSRVRYVIVPQSDYQRAAAKAAKKRLRRSTGNGVYSEIAAHHDFTPAARKHQKFDLQRMHADLVRDLAGDIDLDTFLGSTAATRLNAYVTGFADDHVLAEIAAATGWERDELQRRLDAEPASPAPPASAVSPSG